MPGREDQTKKSIFFLKIGTEYNIILNTVPEAGNSP